MSSYNILYLIQQAANWYYAQHPAGGSPAFTAAIPMLLGVMQIIEWTAIIISVLFLCIFIWARLKLEVVEHHEHHERHEAELEYAHEKQHHEVVSSENRRWLEVLALANSTHESDWRRAILEADIMMDGMLREHGYIGETVGERLKGVNADQYPTVNAAWESHRLRNAVAHLGEGFELTHRDVLVAMDGYRRFFEEFEYI